MKDGYVTVADFEARVREIFREELRKAFPGRSNWPEDVYGPEDQPDIDVKPAVEFTRGNI